MNNPAINTPPLHVIHASECQRLFAEGLSKKQIAKHVGISDKTVLFSLASDERKAEILERSRNKKKTRAAYYGKPHNPPPKHKVKRTISQPVPKEVFDAAILAFAKHEISREQMMFRITPQHKWRGKSWEEM